MSRNEMTTHERMLAFFKGQDMDRLPAIEWAAWWGLTYDRWLTEGFPSNLSYKDQQRYFGLEPVCCYALGTRTGATPTEKSFGEGILKTEEEYEKILPTLYPDPEKQWDKEVFDRLRKEREEGDVVQRLWIDGFFWFPRTLLGIEPHLFSFYDQPDLLNRICTDQLNWVHKAIEYIGNNYTFDFMTFAEDMSYNGGPMIGKNTFDEFLAPYYKKAIAHLKQFDTPVIIDSDGNITEPVDWYREVGADGFLPLERQAGVDVSLYIRKQPEMRFIGHFDKMCMKFGPEAMKNEFERLLPSMKTGRFLPSVDHQTPPDVSFENFKAYSKLLKEYCEKAVPFNR